MTALVIGGSRGLGREIARFFQERGTEVVSTGKAELHITDDSGRLRRDIDALVDTLPFLDVLVYAAGFFEQGHIAELSAEHVVAMINTEVTAPALLASKILRKQGSLPGLIAITSTSQWRPREHEPVYAAGKAGLGMLAASLALDPAIAKTLVVAPAAMDTEFWRGPARAGSSLLKPEAVARHIFDLWDGAFTYKLARILRDPERVELLESR